METKYKVQEYVVESLPYIYWEGELMHSGWLCGSGDNPFRYKQVSTEEYVLLGKLRAKGIIRPKRTHIVTVEPKGSTGTPEGEKE